MRAVTASMLSILIVTAIAESPGHAATGQFEAQATSWDMAAAQLGMAGSLWDPRQSAGLKRTRRITVLADNLVISPAGAATGDTFAGTRYGSPSKGFVISEKWMGTGWAAEPAFSTSMARVGTVRIPLGLPGLRIMVQATVYANCFPQSESGKPRPVPRRFRCSRASVLKTGGVLIMTARPASTMTAPGSTSIVIQSTRMTYDQLVKVAESLEQVAGAAAQGAGSAQMVSMCAQMVSQAMTVERAQEYAQPLGYTVRIGSIDGQPLAVTADYRPERFTVSTVAGAVTSCTYG